MAMSSRTVKLALIGTAVGSAFLIGTAFLISSGEEEPQVADDGGDWGQPQPENVAGTSQGTRTGHGGIFIIPGPRIGGGGGGGGGFSSAPSARGGFGSSGFSGGGSASS